MKNENAFLFFVFVGPIGPALKGKKANAFYEKSKVGDQLPDQLPEI